MYNHITEEQEKRLMIDSSSPMGPVQYISHRHVNKYSKTTPIKIVYDCNYQLLYFSLNDCLETPPPLVNDLWSRSHVHKLAMSTKIERASSLIPTIKILYIFFWLSNPEDAESDHDTYYFKVVLFGAASSTFMLGATLRLHLSKHDSLWHTTELVCWQCDIMYLGNIWNTNMFHFDLSSNSVITKCSIIQEESSRVYNPLGILSPIFIHAKLLMQQHSVDWDEPLNWNITKSLQQTFRMLHWLPLLPLWETKQWLCHTPSSHLCWCKYKTYGVQTLDWTTAGLTIFFFFWF